MMIREDTSLGNRFAALLHEADLLCDITETADNLFISIVERENRIWDTSVSAEFQNLLLGATQVVARHAWVQMVDGLELQTSMEEIEPCWAVDVHSGAKHLLREGLADS